MPSSITRPALAAGVLISKRLVTLLVAVHVCFIFNLTSHLCSRACVRRIKCKQSPLQVRDKKDSAKGLRIKGRTDISGMEGSFMHLVPTR